MKTPALRMISLTMSTGIIPYGKICYIIQTMERLGRISFAKLGIKLAIISLRLYWGGARSRAGTLHQLTSNLSGNKNLAGSKPGPSDFALFSAIVNLKLQGDLSAEVFISST